MKIGGKYIPEPGSPDLMVTTEDHQLPGLFPERVLPDKPDFPDQRDGFHRNITGSAFWYVIMRRSHCANVHHRREIIPEIRLHVVSAERRRSGEDAALR